mgnify:CR=1 FL=1
MRLTASRLHLADRCPASCALPTAADWADSDAAAAGTGRHAYLSALAATGSREAALATVPDGAPWRAPCEAIDTEALLAGVARIEHDLAHSYDPERDTASPIVVDAHRAYELDDTQIPGTLDWLVTRLDGSVEVVDFKGEMPVTPAASNLQLALYALQAARSRGLDEITVSICYVRADGTLDVTTNRLARATEQANRLIADLLDFTVFKRSFDARKANLIKDVLRNTLAEDATLQTEVRLGVILGSVLSAGCGYILLRYFTPFIRK